MARLRLLLALGLIGVGTIFGALALSGYYSPGASQKQHNVASIDSSAGSQLVRAKPRQRLVAADTQAPIQPATTQVISQATTQATAEVLPWAKPKPPVVKSPPREAAGKPKDKPKDAVAEKRPQQAAAVPWPWNLLGY